VPIKAASPKVVRQRHFESHYRQLNLGRYQDDPFCKKFMTSGVGVKGITSANGLWYVGDRLLIPRVSDIRENLFRLAHDTTGHFGADKSYVALCNSYYWPNMRHDLELAYVPACMDCQ
jgi:hypothetical protein